MANEKFWERVAEAKKKQETYHSDYLSRLTAFVSEYMDEESNLLVPRIEELETHELTMATYVHGAYVEIATNTNLVRMARNERDKIVGRAKLQVRDHYSNRDLKIPSEHLFDAEISQNPLVTEAEALLAEAEERLILSQGMLKAMEIKASLLPGLQGLRRMNMTHNGG